MSVDARSENASSSSSTPPTQQSCHSRPSSKNASASSVQTYFASVTSPVLLRMPIIDVCHLETNYRSRTLINWGFEATLVSDRLFNFIKLAFRNIQTQVSGLNHSVSAKSLKLCHIGIRSPYKPGLQFGTAAYVLSELAGKQPYYPIHRNSLKWLPAHRWPDTTFFESSQIDILIGADIMKYRTKYLRLAGS